MLHKLGIAGYCERCDAEITDAHVEAFEMTGEFICSDCFDAVCEDALDEEDIQ